MLEGLRESGDDTIRLSLAAEVHGGLTYAAEHKPLTQVVWQEWKKSWQERLPKRIIEAATYPVGAAARFLKRWAGAADSYVIWKTICTTTTSSFPLNTPLWLFGFDCSHAGDLSPGLQPGFIFISDDIYRDFAYAKAEVESLAKQLASWRK